MVGRPLQRRVVRVAVARAVVPEVEREEVVAEVAQVVEVGLVAPAVAQVLVAEDEDARRAARSAARR